MATKRPSVDVSGAPPAKKPSLAMSPLDIGPAAGEEDLDTKVLQVQNSKLSERLRERNHHREQLEARIEKMEHRQEDYMRFQVALKQHFLGLRERLLVAMVPLRCEEDVMSEEEVKSVQDVGGLERLTQAVYNCLDKLSRASRGDEQATQEGLEASDRPSVASHIEDGSVRFRSLALLDELARHHEERAEPRKLQETVALLENKCEQLQEEVTNLRFSLEQSLTRGDRLETRLEATLADLHSRPVLHAQASEENSTHQLATEEGQEGSTTSTTSAGGEGGGAVEDKSDEMETVQGDLQEAKELAQSRLEEVEKLSLQVSELRKQVDRLKLEQQQVPEATVKESAAYKSLQGQFSIAALEAAQFRAYLEEAKALLVSARQQHFSQLEEIRNEEVKYQLEVREEMTVLESALAAVKHDYSVLRMEFERTVASNEQAAPIAKELRITVDSLQRTISQHKSEVGRYKARAHKAEQQLAKLQEEGEKEKNKPAVSLDKEDTSDLHKAEEGDSVARKAEDEREAELERVRTQLKAVESELETCKQAASSEERERAEIIGAEKKARNQVEELKKRFEDYRRDYEKRKEHIREEAARKTKSLTEDNRHLQKDLSAKKHEAQALVAEMECTTQAFEEMQEQNLRLFQQLKEKEDANFKQMSERIKSNSVQKLLQEEKDLLCSQLNAMAVERQRYSDLVSQLEERERMSEATIQGLDKELALQQQAGEAHRKKTDESLQELAHIHLEVSEKQKLMISIEQTLSSRTGECEKESQVNRKNVEDIAALKRKLEKYKSREWMAAGDEVLLEEIKMYKAKLNCPCCSARKKDTVLTKCFHVFCSECIRNRYDSRLRKCPKCGAAFGANDFHKIYLS